MSYILFNLTTAIDGMAGEVHYGNKHEVQDSFTWILGLFHLNTLRSSLLQHTSGPVFWLIPKTLLTDFFSKNTGVPRADFPEFQVSKDAAASLCTILTILAVILLLSFAFSEKMRHKILGPMERIVKILEQLIQDPMAFAPYTYIHLYVYKRIYIGGPRYFRLLRYP